MGCKGSVKQNHAITLSSSARQGEMLINCTYMITLQSIEATSVSDTGVANTKGLLAEREVCTVKYISD